MVLAIGLSFVTGSILVFSDFEMTILKLIDTVTNGSKIEINETGKDTRRKKHEKIKNERLCKIFLVKARKGNNVPELGVK